MHWILLTAISGATAKYKQGCCSNILNKATANLWQSTTKKTENKRTLFLFQGNSKPKETFSLAPSTTADIWLLQEFSCAEAAAADLLPQTGDIFEKSTVATQWSLRYCSTPLCSPVKITNVTQQWYRNCSAIWTFCIATNTSKGAGGVWGETSSRLSQEKGLCSFILLTPKKNYYYPKLQDACNLFLSPYSSVTYSFELPFSPQHSSSQHQTGRVGKPYCTHVNCSCFVNKHRYRTLGMSTGYFKQAPITKIRVAVGITFFLMLSNSESINAYQALYILSKNIYSVKNRTIW